MQKYRWPGVEMHLIRELQKQQNGAQFCDTLLQTDGISVPTHSCILAALSPQLSQRLSASASLPSGQKHQLQLQPVKAQTLLKLVGLMYSGELEVNESIELNDVLTVARQLGISDCIERQKDGDVKEWDVKEKMQGNHINAQGSEREEKRKIQDEAEIGRSRDAVLQVHHIRYVSRGTQTVTPGEKLVGSCISCFRKCPTPECAPSQSVEFSAMLQPQNIIADEQFCFPSCPVIPSMPSAAQNNTQSTLDRCACNVMGPESTSSLSNNTMAIPSDESNIFMAQGGSIYRQVSECGNNIQALAKERTALENGERSRCAADNRTSTEQIGQASRNEIRGDERGRFAEKRNAHVIVGMKNLAMIKQMQQMLETTQMSCKVKLRRTCTGDVWQVVSPQDTVKIVDLAFHQQGGSTHKRGQVNADSAPYNVELFGVHKPETPILNPTTLNCPRPSPHYSLPRDYEVPSIDSFEQNQRPCPEAAPVPQSQGPVEESDEQIAKLLDDIMMGLNILPNLESDCKKSHHVQPSSESVSTVFRGPVAQNDTGHSQLHGAVSEAECLFYQVLGTQSGHFPNTGESEGMACRTMLPCEVQESLHPQTPNRKPHNLTTSAFSESGQKQHYQQFQEQSSQDILGFLPLVSGNETQSLPLAPLPCMEDFRLPRCLSPLESRTSSASTHQAVFNPVNLGDKLQQQRPWLIENPGSLQYPLSAINHRQNKVACLSRDTNRCCWSQQQHEELNPQSWGTWSESCNVQKVQEKEIQSGSLHNVSQLKSHSRKMKKRTKGQQGDTERDAVTYLKRKRKLPVHPQDPGSLLVDKVVKASAGQKGHINLSSCSVNLFSNNALVNKRAVDTCSSNMPSIFVGKLNQPSSVAEFPRTKEPGMITEQTQIMTRGLKKRTQESTCSTRPQNSSCLSFRSKVNNNGETVPKRKRGRPPKAKVYELISPKSSPAAVEGISHNEECDPQIDKGLSKEDLKKGDKRRRGCKRKMGNGSVNLGETPQKNLGSKSPSKPDANNNDIIPTVRKLKTPKRSPMVSLKEFQKLIKLQHSKVRKSKECPEMYETVREDMANRNGIMKDSSTDTKVDADAKLPGRGGSEGSVTFSVTVEEDPNRIWNELDPKMEVDTESVTGKETSVFGDSLPFSSDVLQGEAARLDAQKKLLRNTVEGGKSCDAKESFTTQETPVDIEGSSHSYSPLKENKLASDHNVHLQAPGSSLSCCDGTSTTSSCDQEEEEVEVDVTAFSPDMVPQAKVCEHGLDKKEITPEEDEEGDLNDIDVTGDEEE